MLQADDAKQMLQADTAWQKPVMDALWPMKPELLLRSH